MSKLLTDKRYAVRGRLVAVDNSVPIGPMFTIRVPPTTGDPQRPASCIDMVLLDSHRKTLQKRISLDDELEVIVHAATTNPARGTRDEMTFEILPLSRCQRISHCRRVFDLLTPINGKVLDNDSQKTIVVDAGIPMVVSLLDHKPSQTAAVKINSWVTFWPNPPTHGIILGKA